MSSADRKLAVYMMNISCVMVAVIGSFCIAEVLISLTEMIHYGCTVGDILLGVTVGVLMFLMTLAVMFLISKPTEDM